MSQINTEILWEYHLASQAKQFSFAKETRTLCSLDASGELEILSCEGELLIKKQTPHLEFAEITADGKALFTIDDQGRMQWLDLQLEAISKKIRYNDIPLGIGVHPFGWYALIANSDGKNRIYGRDGEIIATFKSIRPCKFWNFIWDQPAVVGTSESGWMGAFTCDGDKLFKADANIRYGKPAASASGEVIVAPAFMRGVHRYDEQGKQVGAYQLNWNPACVDITQDGLKLLAASQEGNVALLTYHGKIIWQDKFAGRIDHVAIDSFGQLGWCISSDGSVRCISFGDPPKFDVKRNPEEAVPVYAPNWSLPLKTPSQSIASLQIKPLPIENQIAVLRHNRKLAIYARDSEKSPNPAHDDAEIYSSKVLFGNNPILKATDKGCIVLTDRRCYQFDSRKKSFSELEVRLSDISFFDPVSDSEAVVVEDGVFLSRIQFGGGHVWRKSEIGSIHQCERRDDTFILSSTDGFIRVFGADGSLRLTIAPSEEGTQLFGVMEKNIISVAQNGMTVRAHTFDGQLSWTLPLPIKAWATKTLSNVLIISSVDRTHIAVDFNGKTLELTKSNPSKEWFEVTDQQDLLHFYFNHGMLICTDLRGNPIWRTVGQSVDHIICDPSGVYGVIDEKLCWFNVKPGKMA